MDNDAQNILLLNLMEASLGCISEPIRAIYADFLDTEVVVHFYVIEPTSEVMNDISDIMDNFETAMDINNVRARSQVHLEPPGTRSTLRWLYRAKDK